MIRSLFFGSLLFLLLTGCLSMRETSDATLRFNGIVAYKEFEGGFWALDAEDGRKFLPLNLPETYRQDGLKIRVEANEKADVVDIYMYGTPIEILTIDKRE